MIQTQATILCALCGIKFLPTFGSICQACTIKSLQEHKILDGQQINYCRYCMRFEKPPWVNCERQSQQMLTLLLKKTKGLNKVEVQSASFIWTEPHSKRLKLKVVFSREITQKMKLEITEVVEFVEKYTQCSDCKKKFTPHDWIASVQLRQQTNHKKTILNLQQILLKHKVLDKIIKSQQVQGGVDIFFSSENDAMRLLDFLKGRFPVSIKSSSKLISHNERDNTSNVKITYSCIIPKVCKDDLVLIPLKLSKELGSCSQLLLCTKVSSYLHFLDVVNFKKVQISSMQYFLFEGTIQIFSLKIYGRKFSVLDCQAKSEQSKNKYPSYGIQFVKQEDYVPLYAKSHFAEEAGNDLIGFDLTQMQNFEGVKGIPDYLMVQRARNKELKRKLKSNKRKKQAEERRQSESASKIGQRIEQELSDDSNSWQDISEGQQQKIQTGQTQTQIKKQQTEQKEGDLNINKTDVQDEKAKPQLKSKQKQKKREKQEAPDDEAPEKRGMKKKKK